MLRLLQHLTVTAASYRIIFSGMTTKRYPIDRITDVRYATSLKAGGCGIRYTCRILGKERYIFLEENKWFVEVKEN